MTTKKWIKGYYKDRVEQQPFDSLTVNHQELTMRNVFDFVVELAGGDGGFGYLKEGKKHIWMYLVGCIFFLSDAALEYFVTENHSLGIGLFVLFIVNVIALLYVINKDKKDIKELEDKYLNK